MPQCKKFIIQGKLWGLNDYTRACRSKYGQHTASAYKRETEELIGWYIKKYLRGWRTDKRIYLRYHWIEPNTKRDIDNICFARKFIQDALVKQGVIKNDGWKNIAGHSDEFSVDKNNPRIEVEIIEVDDDRRKYA